MFILKIVLMMPLALIFCHIMLIFIFKVSKFFYFLVPCTCKQLKWISNTAGTCIVCVCMCVCDYICLSVYIKEVYLPLIFGPVLYQCCLSHFCSSIHTLREENAADTTGCVSKNSRWIIFPHSPE